MKQLSIFVSVLLVICLACSSALCEGSVTTPNINDIDYSLLSDEELEQLHRQTNTELLARSGIEVSIEPTYIIYKGKTVTISPVMSTLPEGIVVKDMSWESSDSSIVKCNNSKVTGVNDGNAVITLTVLFSNSAEIKVSCDVTVVIPASSISIGTKSISVNSSKYFTPQIVFKPENTTVRNVSFSSSDTSIVNVTSDNKLHAIKSGIVKITATTIDGSNKSCQFTVRVSAFDLDQIKLHTTLKFGRYEQDANENNGLENIEWLVLDRDGTKVLLLSKYTLDIRPFDSRDSGVTWANSSIRKWLNGDFLNTAFTKDQQQAIITSTLKNSTNGGDSYNAGTTNDKVFFLDTQEAYSAFGNCWSTTDFTSFYNAPQTQYAFQHYKDAHAAWQMSTPGTSQKSSSRWWLRTTTRTDALSPETCWRYFLPSETYFSFPFGGVRPAIWIDLTKADVFITR